MAKQIFRIPGLGVGEVATSDDISNEWYVDSVNGAAGASGKTPKQAVTTMDAANNLASAGDTVHVLPGHVETLTTAAQLVPDVAGIRFVGHGRGARRPTITFAETLANIPVSGAGVSFENFLFVTSGTFNVTAGITVTGGDVLLKDIEMRESAADSQWVDGIVAAATSDRMHVDGFIYQGFLTGDADASAISVTGAVDGVHIENFNIDGLFVAAGIENVTGVCTNIRIRNGFIRQRHATTDAGVTLVATSTGTVENVNVRTATNDGAGFTAALVGAAAQFFVCWVVNADGESGGVFGTPSAAA